MSVLHASNSPISHAREALSAVREQIATVLWSKEQVIEHCLIAILAQGHILLEDIPGVGKSSLAHALAQSMHGEFRRVQFTSDLLPADLLGATIWHRKAESFHFHPGPIFCNVLLADEINRSPPRTQGALLEAMEEGQVSIDGKHHPLPRPFLVIATQNPQEQFGTYPLPESQLDRFMMKLSIGYMDQQDEAKLLAGHQNPRNQQMAALLTPELLADIQNSVLDVHIHPDIAGYAQRVLDATRHDPKLRLGVSTRGGLAWMRAASARAYIEGRDFVEIEDLHELALPVLAHRLLLTPQHDQALLAEDILSEILEQTDCPQ